MIHNLGTHPTFATAWLVAAEYLFNDMKPKREAHNLIVEIEHPNEFTDSDRRICSILDAFLRKSGSQPINTVAGTIFPVGFYLKGGAEGVYRDYPAMYPKIHDGWGRYAMRLLRSTGKDGKEIIPLKLLVDKIKRQLSSGHTFKSAYELGVMDTALDLPVFDMGKDEKRLRTNPCLSHLSFKIVDGDRLSLTVMYRYHYYVEKALGNFLGLAQLQKFVADETGLAVGPLTCLSTYAVIDTYGDWGINDLTKMLKEARNTADSTKAA